VDNGFGELLLFNYSKNDPYMHYGVVNEHNDLRDYVDVPLPGPRLPHDMVSTVARPRWLPGSARRVRTTAIWSR
jgi:carotenoid cleavage dioxygenase-like enzyme